MVCIRKQSNICVVLTLWVVLTFFFLLNHIGKKTMKSREELHSEKKLELEKRLLDVNNQLNSRKRQTKRRYLFVFLNLLIYFWLCWVLVAVHGLSLVAASWSYSSSCGAWGSRCGGFYCCGGQALGMQASVVVAHWLQSSGSIHSCGTQTQLPRSMWNFLEPGIKPVSPALAGEFLTIGPPGKSQQQFLKCSCDSLISGIFNVFSYFVAEKTQSSKAIGSGSRLSESSSSSSSSSSSESESSSSDSSSSDSSDSESGQLTSACGKIFLL